jgi:hypothetical protein
MTQDEVFTSILQTNGIVLQQNEVMISLLARLVWTPERLAEAVTANKRNPDAYIEAYNACDGEKTGTQLAAIAGVKQQSMSWALQGWLDDGVVLNIGTEKQPRYRRLMRLPEKKKTKAKLETQAELAITETRETNGTHGQ